MTVVSFRDEGSDAVLRAMSSSFARGDPVVLPTDTLYGLAAPVSVKGAVEAIFRIKGRPRSMTLPIAVGDLDMLRTVSVAEGPVLQRISGLLPGPYTFVLRAAGLSDPLVVRNGTVAVRIPDHPLFGPVTRRFGPMALTSANAHGGPEILQASALDELYSGSLTVIEDDRSLSGRGSEIVDLTGDSPSVLRSGNLNKREALEGPDG